MENASIKLAKQHKAWDKLVELSAEIDCSFAELVDELEDGYTSITPLSGDPMGYTLLYTDGTTFSLCWSPTHGEWVDPENPEG